TPLQRTPLLYSGSSEVESDNHDDASAPPPRRPPRPRPPPRGRLGPGSSPLPGAPTPRAAGSQWGGGLRVRDPVLPAAAGPFQLSRGRERGRGGGVLPAAVPGGPRGWVGRPRRAYLLLLRQRGRHRLVRRQL